MFAYVAASLGKCIIIKEEDGGLFLDGMGTLRRPDFRLVTSDNLEFLVEVKNFRARSLERPFRIDEGYLNSLRKYSELMSVPLKFAIFWSGWNQWTLVDDFDFTLAGGKGTLLFGEALKNNQMGLIGDLLVGIEPPLSVRFHADQTKPRDVSESGEAPFTIGGATLHVAGQEITDETERNLAWFFLLHGKWTSIEQTADIASNQLNYFEISAAPEEVTENQGFEIVGSLAEMASAQYIAATSKGTKVASLSPDMDPDSLGIRVPQDYEGKVLKLWRFHQVRATDTERKKSCF